MLQTVKIERIIPDENQPRKYFATDKMDKLKKSIKKHGIMNPIVVQEEGKNYLLVDGERRFRAAKDLGLKELEVNVLPPKSEIERMVEQFHLQDQHEGWTATEKASVLIQIKEKTGQSLKEICETLGITERAAQMYGAFERIQDKKNFIESGITIDAAEKIHGINKFVQALKNEVQGQEFGKTEQKRLERVIVEKIRDGEMETRRDFTKLKDAFKMSPDTIDTFLGGKHTAEQLYVTSKARSAYYLRNSLNSCGWLVGYIPHIIGDKKLELTDTDLASFAKARDALAGLLDYYHYE